MYVDILQLVLTKTQKFNLHVFLILIAVQLSADQSLTTFGLQSRQNKFKRFIFE